MTIRVKRSGACYVVQERIKFLGFIPVWTTIATCASKYYADKEAERFIKNENAILID